MVKIRLRRVGAKKQPSYRIVVTDSRSPRDGRFIENIGHYNPRTDPPTVVLKEDRALYWLSVGAQPTDAVARFFRKLDLQDKVKKVHKGAKISDLVDVPADAGAVEKPKTILETVQAEVAEAAEVVDEVLAEAVEDVEEAEVAKLPEDVEDAEEETAEVAETIAEKIEDAEIAVLELSARVVKALEAAEVTMVSRLRELREQGEDALTAIAGIGQKAAEEIAEKLDAHDGEDG